MKVEMEEGNLDLVLAFEFTGDGTETIGHLLLVDKCKFLIDIFSNIVSQFSIGFKIKIY